MNVEIVDEDEPITSPIAGHVCLYLFGYETHSDIHMELNVNPEAVIEGVSELVRYIVAELYKEMTDANTHGLN